MGFIHDIRTCNRCLTANGVKCHGACACPVDGRDIIAHAKEHDCPEQKFAAAGLGDVVAKAIHVTRLDRLVGAECSACRKRKAALNNLVPFTSKSAT